MLKFPAAVALAVLFTTTAFASEKPSNTPQVQAQGQEQAQGQLQGQAQGQAQFASVTNNNDNSGGTTNTLSNRDDNDTYVSPSFGMALPSGSNAELAPEGGSVALSSPFGGIGFSGSHQKPSPSAGLVLMHLAQTAWGETSTISVDDQRNGVTAKAFLCEYYEGFAEKARVTCD